MQIDLFNELYLVFFNIEISLQNPNFEHLKLNESWLKMELEFESLDYLNEVSCHDPNKTN